MYFYDCFTHTQTHFPFQVCFLKIFSLGYDFLCLLKGCLITEKKNHLNKIRMHITKPNINCKYKLNMAKTMKFESEE